ncbi:MAG: GNAT family N-acetyltransferase [Acidimicrobiales bacterium]
MASSDTHLEVRRIEPGDHSAVLDLLSASLGWMPNEHFERFFRWKHEESPFGPSPGWVAVERGSIVGFRTFLRWEYERADGEVLRAVRAVDTATHPDHQGKGIFRQLTLRALDELAQEGVGFVFNTPNSQSRPGYLKMGWTEVGRLPTSVRFTSLRSPWRMVRSRVPAERWSTPSRAGRPALEVLADPSVRELLAIAPDGRFRTRRTPEYLRWRYGFGPLEYRALTVTDRAADGFAVFRLRRRGSSLECALVEVLVREGDRAARSGLIRSLATACGADYLIRIGGPLADRSGFIRVPRQGPMLTWRPLAGGPAGGQLGDWDLSLGDVELF